MSCSLFSCSLIAPVSHFSLTSTDRIDHSDCAFDSMTGNSRTQSFDISKAAFASLYFNLEPDSLPDFHFSAMTCYYKE